MKVLILLILFTTIFQVFSKSTFFIGTATPKITKLLFENGNFTFQEEIQDSKILNPTWLTLNQEKQILFAVRETSPNGFVSTFSMNPFKHLDTIPSNGGYPCHTVIHQNLLFVSNYENGIFSVFKFQENGKLSTHQVLNHTIRGRSNAHQVVLEENYVFLVDLGSNTIFQYQMNENKMLIPNRIPKIEMKNGCGPRQLVISSRVDFGYVLCELDATVSILRFNRKMGTFSYLKSVSSLRDGENSDKMFPSELKLLNNGLYLSNRDLSSPNLNRNSIAYFKVQPNGDLRLMQHINTMGVHPRYFSFKNDFLLVANRDSDNIASFRVDPSSGLIDPEPKSIFHLKGMKPTFILEI